MWRIGFVPISLLPSSPSPSPSFCFFDFLFLYLAPSLLLPLLRIPCSIFFAVPSLEPDIHFPVSGISWSNLGAFYLEANEAHLAQSAFSVAQLMEPHQVYPTKAKSRDTLFVHSLFALSRQMGGLDKVFLTSWQAIIRIPRKSRLSRKRFRFSVSRSH